MHGKRHAHVQGWNSLPLHKGQFFGVRIGLVQEMESGNNRDIQIQISSPFLCFHERKKNHQFDLRSICLLYVMSCTAGAICRGCHCGICSAANASVERVHSGKHFVVS